MKKAIRFKVIWKQFRPGDINTEYDYGVMDALVMAQRAEWCVVPVKPAPAIMANDKRKVKA